MKAALLVIIACCALAFTDIVDAQPYQGPQDFHGAVKFLIPHVSNYPPYRSDMPWNIRTSYAILDSLSRTIDFSGSGSSIIDSFTDSDTLMWALKYLYEVKDFDATVFFQYLEDFPRSSPYLDACARCIIDHFLQRVAQVVPDSGRMLAALTSVDAIVHIQITDTFSAVDTTKPLGMNICQGVSCIIKDVIKGHGLPSCFTAASLRMTAGRTSKLHLSDSCTEYQFWKYWLDDIQEPLGVHTINREPWEIPDHEYIVFLKFIGLGSDSLGEYATLSPAFGLSHTNGIYPIRSGHVYDPDNDFGFGTHLTEAEFKSRLREKIKSITTHHSK